MTEITGNGEAGSGLVIRLCGSGADPFAQVTSQPKGDDTPDQIMHEVQPGEGTAQDRASNNITQQTAVDHASALSVAQLRWPKLPSGRNQSL